MSLKEWNGFMYLSIRTTILLITITKTNFRANATNTTNNIIQASYSDHFKTIKSIIEKILDIGKLTVRWRVLLKNNNKKNTPLYWRGNKKYNGIRILKFSTIWIWYLDCSDINNKKSILYILENGKNKCHLHHN